MRVLIASHGTLSHGIRDTIRILTGLTQIDCIAAYLDESDYTQEIEIFLKSLNGETAVIFTDLYGGSVNQKVMQLVSSRNDVYVVAGFNLPIVLAVLLHSGDMNESDLDKLIDEARSMLVRVVLNNSIDASDEISFFEEKGGKEI